MLTKKLLLQAILLCFLITLSCSDSCKVVKLMTYNIRFDTKEDGINQWNYRKKGLIALIKKLNPDILGIQEGLPNQISYLSKQLDAYSLIGEGREGENDGEYCAIYYKNKKFKLEKGETFWLSETPEIPSIGWDAALKRIATVGVFKSLNSNRKLVVYNSHFDHIGKIAREKSVDVILNHIEGNEYLKNELAFMGDLNSTPNELSIKLIKEVFDDSFEKFAIKKPYGTYNGFDSKSDLSKRIDYIFTKNMSISKYERISEKLPNGLWPSDHFPVLIEIK